MNDEQPEAKNEKETFASKSNGDFSIFDEDKKQCTVTNEAEISIVRKCPSLFRMINALKYYELLSKDNDKNGIFIEFINTIYQLYLFDYIHIICTHSSSNHLNKISQELLNNYNFNTEKCISSVSNCIWTQRHYRSDRKDSKNSINKNNFHLNLFATMHFYMFHLEEVGLRCYKQINIKKPIDITTVDTYFNEMQKEIKKMRKKYEKSGLKNERLDSQTNSKFTIMTTSKDEEKSLTDHLFDTLKKGKENKMIEALKLLMKLEEYDSDSIAEDVIHNYGNISTQNDIIKTFIKRYKVGNAQFSTGMVFFYWDWYRNCDEQQFKNQIGGLFNNNNFGGYKILNLFINKQYNSIKEEVLESDLISMEEFNELVIEKAQIYLQSDKCKQMKCFEQDDILHFDISKDEPLKIYHLQSVILYVDFTAFCTAFSDSFRGLSWNEDLDSIKQRHEIFYHVSKYLNELICYYGIVGYKQNGPFYCGISRVLTIGSFAIRLNAPISTSKHIEVATRFSSKNGIIIQLNNIRTGDLERFIDTSWISSYPEEDERLFIRGRHKLEIESIRLFDKLNYEWKNYEMFFKAFYLFDSILSGDWPGPQIQPNSEDMLVVEKCILHTLGIRENNFDTYINDAFYLFMQQKAQIILNLYELDEFVANKEFVDFVMNRVVSNDTPS
eukprot:41879_1